jgi:hypothetical protein
MLVSRRAGVQSMSDPFREFVAQMARLAVPEDDTEDNRERRAVAVRVGDADWRARRVGHCRLRRRRVSVLGGAGALADDPQGASADHASVATAVHSSSRPDATELRFLAHDRAMIFCYPLKQKLRKFEIAKLDWSPVSRALGCSLHDLQPLASHRPMETTERYVDGQAQRWLVSHA